MKTYDKEKLNEYAKELFALCLDKGLGFNHNAVSSKITIYRKNDISLCAFISETKFKQKAGIVCLPIWELIEKVKQL